MHENVPVRFGRGRLDSLATKGLAAYLITSLGAKRYRDWACKRGFFLLLGLDSRGLLLCARLTPTPSDPG